jgi:methylthioribose-1-phosphate isomerase
LTHCNVSGELAMAAAMCRKENKRVRFYCTETRPYFQGAKLTAWELNQVGAQVTLVPDNAVGSLMVQKMVNRVIIGSDRSCANGDVANKIGSYQIAVLAKEFGIPLCVLTQPSNKIKAGRDIPIELRDAKELLSFEGKKVYAGKVKGFYPGFDVVPHELITEAIAINAGA